MVNKSFRPVLVAGFGLMVAAASYAADSPAQPPSEASTPAATNPTTPAATPNAAPPKTEMTPEAKTEADAASHLEKKFQEAARSYRQVQKNGQTMYCKKEKPINSTIPRMQCISESELRLQVEQMDSLRDRMRNQSRCTTGVGCQSGG